MSYTSPLHDLDRLYTLHARIAELESGLVRTSNFRDEDISADTLAMFRRSAAAIEAAWPDSRLLADYERVRAVAESDEAEAMLAEIGRRGLEI